MFSGRTPLRLLSGIHKIHKSNVIICESQRNSSSKENSFSFPMSNASKEMSTTANVTSSHLTLQGTVEQKDEHNLSQGSTILHSLSFDQCLPCPSVVQVGGINEANLNSASDDDLMEDVLPAIGTQTNSSPINKGSLIFYANFMFSFNFVYI